ncbi:hypothetical protein MAM1_0114d05644 [Mucor ambiguus]|uniref:BZIP domain-containing protein n=1 Tax=Mucor ambiguus TaxID=91626 RepID=A0A0C9LV51_9FUNG|nr:hypothetical protein MAM1_0114d05644 [Mucor ambiguus]
MSINNNTLYINRKDQEPNPFEQSFSSISPKIKLEPYQTPPKLNGGVDTWVTDISSYTFDSNSSTTNDSYSSVSDHQAMTSEDSDDTFHANYNLMPMHPPQQPSQLQPQQSFIATPSNTITTSPVKNKPTKKRNRTVKLPEDEEKRKNFLERNRIAALKCRQRKKQWLSNLQNRVEHLTNDNDQLQMEANALRKEIMDLKTLLVAHKDCPQYNAALMPKSNYTNLLSQQEPVYHHHFTS